MASSKSATECQAKSSPIHPLIESVVAPFRPFVPPVIEQPDLRMAAMLDAEEVPPAHDPHTIPFPRTLHGLMDEATELCRRLDVRTGEVKLELMRASLLRDSPEKYLAVMRVYRKWVDSMCDMLEVSADEWSRRGS